LESVPLVLSALFLEKGRTDLLKTWFHTAKQNTPDHIHLHFIEGRIYEQQKDFEGAKLCYEKVLAAEEKPSFVPVNYRMIKIQACVYLSTLLSTVILDQKRLIEILDMAIRLEKGE
jgi:hypothetical protein